ncbi:MAG: DUF4333 domain-containing protein [Solirubrobacterales bacterium]
MSRIARLAALAALLATALAAAGCGETVIDDAKTEAALEQDLQGALGEKVTAVECPSGVEVEPGATFECDVILAGGERRSATLRIRNEDADIEVTGLKPSG